MIVVLFQTHYHHASSSSLSSLSSSLSSSPPPPLLPPRLLLPPWYLLPRGLPTTIIHCVICPANADVSQGIRVQPTEQLPLFFLCLFTWLLFSVQPTWLYFFSLIETFSWHGCWLVVRITASGRVILSAPKPWPSESDVRERHKDAPHHTTPHHRTVWLAVGLAKYVLHQSQEQATSLYTPCTGPCTTHAMCH